MNTRTSPDRNAPLRWSIVSTLAVLYTIATLAVLALAGSDLYLALESELLLRDTATVSHPVRRLRQGVGKAKAGETPERWSRGWAEHAEGDPRFQSRVLDALPATGWRWRDARKNKFLLVAAQASSADGKLYRLQVAMDLTDSRKVLDGYRVKVGMMLLLGGLCVGLIGYFVARRSMQPLAALAQAIETEGGGRSGAKGYRWPAEFGAVLDAIERRSARRQIDGGS